GDTDTGGQVQIFVADLVGYRQRPDDFFHHQLRILALSEVGQGNHKLVATHSRYRVAGAYQRFQALSRLNQDQVSGTMTEGVVNQFEAIQVDKQQAHVAIVAAGEFAGLK